MDGACFPNVAMPGLLAGLVWRFLHPVVILNRLGKLLSVDKLAHLLHLLQNHYNQAHVLMHMELEAFHSLIGI